MIWILGIISDYSNKIDYILSDLYQKYIENGQKWLNFQLILAFSIEFDHFWLNNWHQEDHFWSFLSKNDQKRLKSVDFNWNWIEIISIQSHHWNSNLTKIDNQNWLAWNPNSQRFNSRGRIALAFFWPSSFLCFPQPKIIPFLFTGF